ncbi:uncharacterized protein LOC142629221 [Castanea sativa]|uniref:uncharacterized protein LOC142629221 n=1 Tax=Castanea sativa TaxID=21020 RepID=UPI003F64DAD3
MSVFPPITNFSREDLCKRARTGPNLVIGFSNKDLVGTTQPHVDVLVVIVSIGGFDMHRVMVDGVSGAEIMYPNLFRGLGLKEIDLESYEAPFMGFDGKMVIPKGRIKLPVQVEKEEVLVDFIVVDAYSPYTAILARPWLHALGAVSSTMQQKVKFPTEVGEAEGDKVGAVEAYESLTKVAIGSNPDKYFQDRYKVLGIDPDFICHQLNMNPKAWPKKQPPRRSFDEHSNAVKEEVNKLKQVGAIKEVFIRIGWQTLW